MAHKFVGRCLLLELLSQKNMSQVELVRLSGISKQRLNHYAHDRKTMSLSTAKLISYHLNCSLDELYSWKLIVERDGK